MKATLARVRGGLDDAVYDLPLTVRMTVQTESFVPKTGVLS